MSRFATRARKLLHRRLAKATSGGRLWRGLWHFIEGIEHATAGIPARPCPPVPDDIRLTRNAIMERQAELRAAMPKFPVEVFTVESTWAAILALAVKHERRKPATVRPTPADYDAQIRAWEAYNRDPRTTRPAPVPPPWEELSNVELYRWMRNWLVGRWCSERRSTTVVPDPPRTA